MKELSESLARFILEQEKADSVEVRSLERITAGASRETWLFHPEVVKEGRMWGNPMVLRKDPQTGLNYSSRSEEFRVLEQAHAHGIPVPQPLYFSETWMDRPFLIMERVFGETVPKRLFHDEKYDGTRQQWAGELGEILARIHEIPLTGKLSFLKEKPSITEQIEHNEKIWRQANLNNSPMMDYAFRWLRKNLPEGHPVCLVHADFRMGNIMFDESGVKAILDWELAKTGDPMYDIAVLCMKSWRFGRQWNRIGGFGQEETFFEAYEKAGGFPVDPDRIRYWEVLANVFWATVTRAQAAFFLKSPRGYLEYAKLGRRTSECEAELLDLLRAL